MLCINSIPRIYSFSSFYKYNQKAPYIIYSNVYTKITCQPEIMGLFINQSVIIKFIIQHVKVGIGEHGVDVLYV